jgi:hypothetical protein
LSNNPDKAGRGSYSGDSIRAHSKGFVLTPKAALDRLIDRKVLPQGTYENNLVYAFAIDPAGEHIISLFARKQREQCQPSIADILKFARQDETGAPLTDLEQQALPGNQCNK